MESAPKVHFSAYFAMMKLIIATANSGKLKEIAELLSPLGFDLEPDGRDVQETGTTLEENAMIKAVAVAEHHPDTWVLADDSGLEVDALGGEPGVYSARYAGLEKNNDRNMAKLLEALQGQNNRDAQFRTVLALVGAGEKRIFEGVVRGKIISEMRGDGGFGYDPIFVPDGYNRTYAEMTLEEKNSMSHRAIALRKLVEYLVKMD